MHGEQTSTYISSNFRTTHFLSSPLSSSVRNIVLAQVAPGQMRSGEKWYGANQ